MLWHIKKTAEALSLACHITGCCFDGMLFLAQ